MKKGGSKVVLDSWALLAYLDGEPAATEVRRVLRAARNKQATVFLSLINYGEALYIIEREQGLQQAQRAIGIVDQLTIRIAAADRQLVFEAAHLKARHRLSYADAFAAALALKNDAAVMTGDPEFESVESEVDIRWL
jgi:predicted nucleic acid-binding protein